MRPYHRIHVNPREIKQIPVVQSNFKRGQPTPRCKIVFITILLAVFITTVIVSIVMSTRSNDKLLSSSIVRVHTTTRSLSYTTLFSNSTTFNTESTSDSTSIPDSSVSATIANTVMTMISETKKLFTVTIDTTAESTITTTMTIIPPNLLINPGAEDDFDGWTQMGPALAIIDSNGKFQKDYYPRSGSNCFAGGNGGGSHSKLQQNINLIGGVQGFTEEQIDSGTLTAFVSFYYQTWRSRLLGEDYSKVDVTIRNSSDDILAGIHTGELLCTPSPGWCYYEKSVQIPPGSRFIYYIMLFYEKTNVGFSIDAYIDDNSLIIM